MTRAWVLAACMALPAHAAAQAREAPSAGADPAPSAPPRAVPDYGSPPEAADPAEALLWIPRVLSYPVHLVFELVVRRPLRWVFRTIELERLDALFTEPAPAGQHDPRHRSWWFVPLARHDHGVAPSVGLAFHARDRGHAMRVAVDVWGTDRIAGAARGGVTFDRSELSLDLRGSHRADRIFHGRGFDSPPSPRTRYAHTLFHADLALVTRVWQRSALSVGARVGVHRFADTGFRQSRELSLEDAIALEILPAPEGYPNGYTAIEPWARASIDTREDARSAHASGVRAELTGAWAVDLERGPPASWARARGSLEVALEVMRDRTLRLRGSIEIVEPLGAREVPFTEEAGLGGPMDRMPGFLPGRLLGPSAASVGLAWRYAVWSWMDAELFIDTGNVFGALFRDFHLERLRLSFGAALLMDDDFTLLFAFGTEPFSLGADLSSVRFALAIGTPP